MIHKHDIQADIFAFQTGTCTDRQPGVPSILKRVGRLLDHMYFEGGSKLPLE